MSDPREYEQYVTWIKSALTPDKQTAFISGQTVLDSPLAVSKAIRQLVLDGHRVVIGRREKIGG